MQLTMCHLFLENYEQELHTAQQSLCEFSFCHLLATIY